ncbi:hypothetical protein [Streptomyces ortus]|uniref:Uncharacterized protein n=1 Tax=Streptomyces ortus TaxID=2867268 RepID=A0ABT3UZJ8_9ACTN|nr:hypothetical protein [Streptomyces ortus]MCX4232054.1 hypothetical protein [Streptomyces ortus]
MSAPEPSADLVADVDDIFLGHWSDDLMAIVRAPYSPNVLLAYAYRDNARHIPAD